MSRGVCVVLNVTPPPFFLPNDTNTPIVRADSSFERGANSVVTD